ncbi:hypothetical protein TNCV_2425211 [Trichonephila clavipes]|nr:hypothetical protein TNCV_2425211 [Trichonephila clavipes]
MDESCTFQYDPSIDQRDKKREEAQLDKEANNQDFAGQKHPRRWRYKSEVLSENAQKAVSRRFLMVLKVKTNCNNASQVQAQRKPTQVAFC